MMRDDLNPESRNDLPIERERGGEPRPMADLDAAALAAHRDAVGRQVAALYSGTDKTEFRA